MEPNEEDRKKAREIVNSEFGSSQEVHLAHTLDRLADGIATALSKARAEQREKLADKVDDMAAEYERQGDYGTINNFVQRVVAANEISAAIRAGDKAE